MLSHSRTTLDALLPSEIAKAAERIGVEKTRLETARLLTLAVLAGAFIAFGAMCSTIAASGVDEAPYGLVRLVSGAVFSLGLILVVVGGAELFTGNNLTVMAWAGGKLRTAELLRAWTLVYVGNFVGALATAVLVYLSGLHEQGGGAVGAAALRTLEAKGTVAFLPALVKGVLANVLVCLAVWLSYGAHSTTDKILAIVPPVTAFVAAGFEHSIANMYLIPYGLLIEDWADSEFWSAIGRGADAVSAIGWDALWRNLLPVTIGNVIGGGVLVGAVYWFVYLRRPQDLEEGE
jgi:formate/nitrite transporter